MQIRVWGCRGSLPTPGPESNRYGGNTTCLELRLKDGTVIVVDAGSGIRKLGRVLSSEKDLRDLYLYLTHSHWDHLLGFPFFIPVYMAGFTIHVRGGPLAKASLKRYLEQQMEPPYFPVPFETLKAEFDFILGDPQHRTIESSEVDPIRLNHPNGGYGFKFSEGEESFVFIPDNELNFQHVEGMDMRQYVEFCQDVDLLFHDAQYTDQEYQQKRGWGHSRVSSTVQLALQAGVKRLGLFHHDPDHSDEQIDGMEKWCREQIAASGSSLEVFAVREGMEIEL